MKRLIPLLLAVAAAWLAPCWADAQTAAPNYAGTYNSRIPAMVLVCSTDGVNAVGLSSCQLSTVSAPTSASLVGAQQTCSTTATQMPSQSYTNGFVVSAWTTNTGNIYIGGAGVTVSNGHKLVPGDKMAYNATNSNLGYYVCDNATDKLDEAGS